MIRRVTATLSILLLLISFSSNAYADAVCKDGWKSKSSGSGTCSWHGGVLNWLPKRGSESPYGRDSYYDRSDNGVDPCKYRKYKESKKECEMRARLSMDRALKYLQQTSPSLGQTYEEFRLNKLWK